MTLLVTGATGTVGGALITQLCTGGSPDNEPVRALVPSPEERDDLRGFDVEFALGDFDRPETLDDALLGVRAALLVSPAGPEMAAREMAFLDAVNRCPDRPHVVKIAALGWESPESRLSADHGKIVERMRSAGIRHTVLAPNGFMQDILRFAAMVQEESALFLPAGQGAVSHVDGRDVAAVAAHVLGRPGPHEGRSYDVTGPAAVTYAEVAEQIGRVAGRDVSYVDTP